MRSALMILFDAIDEIMKEHDQIVRENRVDYAEEWLERNGLSSAYMYLENNEYYGEIVLERFSMYYVDWVKGRLDTVKSYIDEKATLSKERINKVGGS